MCVWVCVCMWVLHVRAACVKVKENTEAVYSVGVWQNAVAHNVFEAFYYVERNSEAKREEG